MSGLDALPRTAQAIAEARAAAEEDREQAVSRRTELERELAEIDSQISSAEKAISALDLAARGEDGASSRSKGRRKSRRRSRTRDGQPRTEAIVELMAAAGSPLALDQLVEGLHGKGRDDERKSVSATLSHLNRQGRVEHAEDGTWYLVE